MKYGDYGSKETEDLTTRHATLMAELEDALNPVLIKKLHEILEVEYQLTRREYE